MGQAKDAANKPRGQRPARTCKKPDASPDDNQFNIALCWHPNSPHHCHQHILGRGTRGRQCVWDSGPFECAVPVNTLLCLWRGSDDAAA
jgi:hypothetical protein